MIALLVLASACSDSDPCLTTPGGCDKAPPPAVLKIASFSMIYYQSVSDDECFDGCEMPVIEVVETAGGRASITSIRTWESTAQSWTRCLVNPGQRRTFSTGQFNFAKTSTVGQERSIAVTYADGAGGVETLTANVFVTAGKEPPIDTECRFQ